MKILFLGSEDSPLVSFLKESEEVVVWPSDQAISADFVRNGSFDFLVSYGYRLILRKEILDFFPNRAINLHISYLPWNRGSDPNFWSFLEGTPKGVSIHYIDQGIDTGDLIVRQEVFFSGDETLKTSYETLKKEIEKLFCGHWKGIREGKVLRRSQPEGGSFHKKSERAFFDSGLLKAKGWETPVKAVEAFGIKNGHRN